MLTLKRVAAASATAARFGAGAALCWIGVELHAIAESARFIDPSPARQAAALESIAARLRARDEGSLARGDASEIVAALHEVRDAINADALKHR